MMGCFGVDIEKSTFVGLSLLLICKRLFNRIKAGTKGGNAGQWSARKAQMLAREYKKAGGGYK